MTGFSLDGRKYTIIEMSQKFYDDISITLWFNTSKMKPSLVSISSLNEFEILSSRSLIAATSPTKILSRGGAADRGGTGGGECDAGRILRSAAFKSDRRDFNSVSRASLSLVFKIDQS